MVATTKSNFVEIICATCAVLLVKNDYKQLDRNLFLYTFTSIFVYGHVKIEHMFLKYVKYFVDKETCSIQVFFTAFRE